MLTGIHFLLTYTCLFECDHCFLHCSPRLEGTFTDSQVRQVLDEAGRIGTVEWIYFEGGEPFLFYPLLVNSVREARERGFKVGLVTNAYWAISEEDAELWLTPLRDLGIEDLSISDDVFHSGEEGSEYPANAAAAARRLGIPSATICIEKPSVEASETAENKGKPVVGGSTRLRGRAAEKLSEGLPHRPFAEFSECPHEELEHPERVHVDCFGHVHICQGLSMGNMWTTPLSELVKNYQAAKHPVCGPLVDGGPALLAKTYGVKHAEEYVEACHFCYFVRKNLLDRFPDYLAPRQVYGIEDSSTRE
jgi:hypothetical protein